MSDPTTAPSGLPPRGEETYLGDGLYASFDGWHLHLRAPRDGGDHFVGLEPAVYQALGKWVSQFPHMKSHLLGLPVESRSS